MRNDDINGDDINSRCSSDDLSCTKIKRTDKLVSLTVLFWNKTKFSCLIYK